MPTVLLCPIPIAPSLYCFGYFAMCLHGAGETVGVGLGAHYTEPAQHVFKSLCKFL